MDDFLYIFLHVPKTAGTTFNFHAKKNLKADEAVNFTELAPELNKNESKIALNDSATIKKLVSEKILQIPEDQRAKVKLFYNTHLAYCGIHELFGKKPRYFTFVRDPVSRVISIYNYLSTLYFLEDMKGKLKPLYLDLLLVNKKYPEFEEWVKYKYVSVNWSMLMLPMAKYYQTIGVLDDGKVTIKSIKKMFSKFYFVGTTSTFDEDVLYLYNKLGFHKFFLAHNSSIKYFNPKNKADYAPLIRKKDEASFEIFDQGVEFNTEFRKVHKDFHKIINKMKYERMIKLPFTQVAYDPRGVISYASTNLRKNVPYYGKLLNYVKHNFKN